MPGGDRTGPRGMGPMTGRGAGYCAGFGVPGYMNPAGGFGFGRGLGMGRWIGRGGGRGRRNRFFATGVPGWVDAGAFNRGFYPPAMPGMRAATGADRGSELEALRRQAAFLAESLEYVRRRIDEIGGETSRDEA